MGLTWASIDAGRLLPTRIHPCSRMEIIKYAAGSGDYYPLHLDPDAAESRELGTLVVPGRFKQACLGRLVAEWVGHHGFVRQVACRYVAFDPIGRPLAFKGVVRQRLADEGCRLIRLRIWTETEEGRVSTLGTATIEWKGP